VVTIEDNVLSAAEWDGGGGGLLADLTAFPTRRRTERERRVEVGDLIEQRGPGAVRSEQAGSLPIGVAHMVEVARAPITELDEGEADCLGEWIQGVKAEGDWAVIVVEHNVGFVMGQSDPVVVLNLGEVLAMGTREIQLNAAVRAPYLGAAIAVVGSATSEPLEEIRNDVVGETGKGADDGEGTDVDAIAE
jgi:branched-chain amino acid transport system ATP-binding protein